MNTFNVGFSGDTDAMFHRLLAVSESLKMLDGIKVAVIVTSLSKDDLLAIEGVSFVEADAALDLVAHSWHRQRISTQFLPLPATPYTTNDGEGSTIYLVDSAVEITPELDEANIRGLYADPETSADGHGTNMASLIVGKTVGVSPKAHLVTVGIPLNAQVTISKILTAFNAILSDPLRPAVSVVNCSWSIPKSQLLDSKITELQSAGIVVVAAAGNSQAAADDLSPVGLDTVLGVGACDVFDRVIAWESGASNWGPEVDIFAPGIDVPVGDLSLSGTSVSAAVTSAVVAQFITQNPSDSAAQIQQKVIQKSVPDVLFWDETVYGTTPNRLLQSCRLTQADLWNYTAPDDDHHVIKNGDALVLNISVNSPVAAVNYDVTTEIRPPIHPFGWVFLEPITPDNVRLTIAPVGVAVGKYIIALRGLDAEGKLISALWIRVGVYNDSESEISPLAAEQYLVYNTDTDTVQLTSHTTCCSFGCPKGSICCTFTGQVDDYACVEDNTGAVACCGP